MNEIVYLMMPLIKTRKSQVLLLILLHKHKQALLQIHYRKKIPLLLANCITADLLETVCGVHHLVRDIYRFITSNCLGFLMHDLCKQIPLLERCSKISSDGID